MSAATSRTEAVVESLDVHACTVPTDAPESDGTLAWDSTTIVVVEAHAGGETGLGYTYCDTAAAELIRTTLEDVACGSDALDVRATWLALTRRIRNVGRPGIAFCARLRRSTRRSGT